jgi:hypothetical protein
MENGFVAPMTLRKLFWNFELAVFRAVAQLWIVRPLDMLYANMFRNPTI